MLLQEQIASSLEGLRGLASDVPKTVGWAAGGGPTVEIDFTAVDLVGCAFRELRITAEELKDTPVERLKAWADEVCRKVTYLLEHLGRLEVDGEAQAVLIRSTPPAKNPVQTSFYEVLLQAPGTLCLRRYTRANDDSARQPCDIRITHEVLVKLVGDLVDSIPRPAE
jgi:hypothetical protein